MQNPTIDDYLDGLREEFESSAEWRRSKAQEYPDDERNVMAAEQLETLAKTVGDVSPQTARKYIALDGREDLLEAQSEAIRLIGFHSFPDTADKFLRDLVAEVTRSRP